MEAEFEGDLAVMSNDEIRRRKDSSKSNIKAIDNRSNKINIILEVPADNDDVFRITQQYELLLNEKGRHSKELQQEIHKRELVKQQRWKKFNIKYQTSKIQKIQLNYGYILSQYIFQKLHLSRTPKQILPDLLRINFLEKPALPLTKNVEDRDEIWRRLKKACGDSRILLSKKLEV